MPGTGSGLPNDVDRKSRKDLIQEHLDEASIDCRPKVGPATGGLRSIGGRIFVAVQLDNFTLHGNHSHWLKGL